MNHSESPRLASTATGTPVTSETSATPNSTTTPATQASTRVADRVDPRATEHQPTMLIVEYDPASSSTLSAALEPLGAKLVRASSSQALGEFLDQDFAAVVLNAGQANASDAFDIARAMRSREGSHATPIIFVLPHDREVQIPFEDLELGIVDVLYAPIDPAVLRVKAAVLLKLYRLRDASALAEQLRSANVHLRHAAAEAQDARVRAEEARRAKDQFLATMSHEIRTPINAILGYAQIIELGLAGAITTQQRGFLARLRTSSDHLLGLVNDVLDLSKIDAAEMHVARERHWTGAAVAAAIELSSGMAAARGIEIVDGRPGEPGVPYVGDEHRVRQILLNLLSNAIKFTEPNGRVSVDCDTQSEAPPDANLHGGGPWARISVTDTGIGVAAEDHARIFEPFHQVDAGHTRSRGGTGLGLSISRRLAQLMSGDLTVESTPGGGSSFTLWLPSAAAAETAEDRSSRATPDSGAVRVRGLREIGEALRDEAHAAVRAYALRLRSDPATPRAAQLRQPDLEDHAVTFIADIAQSLIIVNETAAESVELLRDATEIQRTIAERHGLRRHRQGWSEESVRRDFAVLREEVERAARSRIHASSEDTDQALSVVRRLIERAEEISCRTWREANQRGDLE